MKNSVINKKKCQPRVFFYFQNSLGLMTAWHTHGISQQINEVVTWNGFQFQTVPCQELISAISCLLNVFQTITCLVDMKAGSVSLLVQLNKLCKSILLLKKSIELSKVKIHHYFKKRRSVNLKYLKNFDCIPKCDRKKQI